MDGNVIFQTLTGFILALFAAVFLTVYLYDRRQKFTGWLAIAYMLGIVTFLLDVTRFTSDIYSAFLTNILFWATSGAIAAAGYAYAERKFSIPAFLTLFLVGISCHLVFTGIYPDNILRSSSANIVAGLIIALCVFPLYQTQKRRIDRTVFVVFTAIAITWCIRPIISFGIFSSSYEYTNYASSGYALILHLSSAISALAGAAVMLLAAGLDIANRLHRMSVTDHLTGLRNRRGLEELFNALEAADNQLSGRAVMTLDIDGFKLINDKFGHGAGDAVLKHLGNSLHELSAKIGKTARIGGEEFVVILSKPCSPEAKALAENIRSALAMLHHSDLPEGYRVTVSIGIALIRDGESGRSALRRADIALYAAKADGRNCVRVAEDINMKMNAA